MEGLAVLAAKLAVVGVLGFLAAVVLRSRESFFGYFGLGWIGLKVGEWAGHQLGLHDPTEIQIGSQETPFLFGFAGSIIILLVYRLALRLWNASASRASSAATTSSAPSESRAESPPRK